jgi:hypothetical protein
MSDGLQIILAERGFPQFLQANSGISGSTVYPVQCLHDVTLTSIIMLYIAADARLNIREVWQHTASETTSMQCDSCHLPGYAYRLPQRSVIVVTSQATLTYYLNAGC